MPAQWSLITCAQTSYSGSEEEIGAVVIAGVVVSREVLVAVMSWVAVCVIVVVDVTIVLRWCVL